jgi:hypothetical protein
LAVVAKVRNIFALHLMVRRTLRMLPYKAIASTIIASMDSGQRKAKASFFSQAKRKKKSLTEEAEGMGVSAELVNTIGEGLARRTRRIRRGFGLLAGRFT